MKNVKKKFDKTLRDYIIGSMNNRLRKADRITMDDIARGLDVSKTTVSRAISGKGRIGKETRDKVLEYIESMGYQPNTMARALAVSRTYNIGVVIPDDAEHGDAPFFKDCLVGITEASQERDYDTILVVVSNGNTDGLQRLVTNHKVDGIVLTRFDADGHVVSYLKEQEMPFILIGNDADDDVLQIDSNQLEGCCELISSILAAGSKEIALLGGREGLPVERIRYRGFEQAFINQGKAVDQTLVFWNAEGGLDVVLDRILERKAGCIACSDDMICIKVMEKLKERGIMVPQDIQVVSFFDSEQLADNEVPVTALHVDTRSLSTQAGNLLIDFINGKKPANRNFAECSVLYRNSSL